MKLIVNIEASTVEVDLDGYYDSEDELDSDSLYDGFVYEIITQPDYDWKVVDDDGNEVELD